VKLLLAAGADVTVKNSVGRTVRDYAVERKLDDILVLLDP